MIATRMLRSITRTCELNRSLLAIRQYRSFEELEGKPNSGPDVVNVGGVALMTLPESRWGPELRISSLIRGVGDKDLAVARMAFSKHNDRPRLDEMIKNIGDSIVAVSSSLLHPDRCVVDEYKKKLWKQGHNFDLAAPSQDLFKFISKKGITPVIVPESEFPLTDEIFNRNGIRAATLGVRQSTNSVLMVSPNAFGFNEEAAEDNTFMNGSMEGDVCERALKEFKGLHHALTEKAGIQVHLFEHSVEHKTPDAVFPNNWFTTHQVGEAFGTLKRGRMVLYPLKCPNRRRERRSDIIRYLSWYMGYLALADHETQLGWTKREQERLFKEEEQGRYFEGTGAMVLDRVNGVVYVAASERADLGLAEDWADNMGYKEVVSFRATDGNGYPIYHTNVMMAIGTDFAVVCSESVADESERQNLLAKLSRRHHVIEISRSQVDAFCGNILELMDGRGVPIVAMSTRALNAFTDDQKKSMLKNVAGIVDSPLDTIETVGGGGVRCTLAELF